MPKILVVDDDPSNRELLRARLEQMGYSSEEAASGEDALRMLETGEIPDLVFLDVMMPRVDGWQVCRQIKSNAKTKGIPVVMLTALGQQIDQLRGYENGADAYLMKPWNFEELRQVLAKHVPIEERPAS
jgi:CheY-like chemotaxis protein